MADLGNLPKTYSAQRMGRALLVPVQNNSRIVSLPKTRHRPRRNNYDNRAPGNESVLLGATSGEVVTLLENGQFVNASRAVDNTVSFYDLDDGTYVATSSVRETSWRIVVTAGVPVVTPLTESGGGSFEPSFAYVS